MPPQKLPPPPPPNIFAKSKAPCIGPPAPFGIKLFIMPEKPPPPPNWLSTDPMLLGVQLILRLPCGMQALTSDEAAVPMASPIFMPVIAPRKAPTGPPTKNPPTPPMIPPATLPISGPYFRTVFTKNPATLGTILVATFMMEPRNNFLSFPSNSFRLVSSSRSNSIFLVLELIFSLAIVRLENLTSTFFQPVDSSRAFVNTSPSSLQKTQSSIFLELFFAYCLDSSSALSAANSINCLSLTKKEVLPKGDIRIVIPVSVSMLCRQNGVEEPCCKFLPSLSSIGQVMKNSQLRSSELIQDRSMSCSLAMPKIEPPGIVTSVRWITLTSGEQNFMRRQMAGPIIASTKQVMPRETLQRNGSLKVSNYGSESSGA